MKTQLFIQYGLKSMGEAKDKYEDLKNERKSLRKKLDKFQKDFESIHNRKIKYTKDIAPVSNDFKLYKEMKIDLGKFETVLDLNQS